eukprot:TRINITY_DN7874_c0_g1_i4.p1 TRINITY_DN7874_c0_g1~~TRINITY_DN7874_c0_g1_i4.p1  ORF type:complete len:160 (+),score=14.13 TRINITY_DN7874_c0_g1_i4:234-713(+)
MPAVASITNIAECCRCCSKCWREFSRFFDRPFSCWTIFCFFLLGAGAVLSFIYASKYWDNVCNHSLHVGLLVIGICYLVLNFANFYTMFKYSREYGRHGEARSEVSKDICAVTWRFLCYDFFMCFYMLFLVFSIVWSAVYLGYANNNTKGCSGNICVKN